MKQILAIVIAASAISFVGCTKASPDVSAEVKYIQAHCSIDGSSSKAPIEGTNAVIDQISFVRADHTDVGQEATITFAGITPFDNSSRAVGGKISFGSAQAYDTGLDKTTYLLGYRPTLAPVDDKVTWTLDGMTDVMTTNVWSAGRLSETRSTGMIFKHELARLEVVCVSQAGIAQSVIASMWGNIEYIKLKGAVPSVELSYATKSVTAVGTPIDFPLVKADYTSAFVPVAIPSSSNLSVTASAMVAPISSKVITLLVKSSKLSEKEIAVTLTANLERAKTHKVTLTFKANGKDIECDESSIEDWTAGASAGADVVEPEKK